MNYAPNTRHWNPGDVVIHDADAKDISCLMFVESYTRKGEAVTRYIYPHSPALAKKRYTNPVAYLHDPALFPKIEVPQSFDLAALAVFTNKLIALRGTLPLKQAAAMFINFAKIDELRKGQAK